MQVLCKELKRVRLQIEINNGFLWYMYIKIINLGISYCTNKAYIIFYIHSKYCFLPVCKYLRISIRFKSKHFGDLLSILKYLICNQYSA